MSHLIIMSDPRQLRADGCSVFISLVLGLIFISAYFIFQIFFDIEESSDTNPLISEQRRQKVEDFQTNSAQFENYVDQFHNDTNSTLESSMLKTIEIYSNDTTIPLNSK